jgi:hypothetical protein
MAWIIFRIYNRWAITPDDSNFSDIDAIFSISFNTETEYKDRPRVSAILVEAFNVLNENEKTKWINSAAEKDNSSSPEMYGAFYAFACSYSGNALTSKSLEFLIKNDTSYRRHTTLEFLKEIYQAPIPDESKGLYFHKIQESQIISIEVKRKATEYYQHFRK